MITKLLIKLFVRDSENINKPEVRLSYGIFSGIVGIAVNFLLFILKFSVGLISGSVAIAADAINNLSDAGSAIVTVFGFKIAAKPADSDHPFGHGRIEYVAGVVVSIIILAMGFDFLKEAILRIFNPVAVSLNTVMLILLASSIIFKAWLFFFYRNVGKKINSQTITAAAFDSLSDTVGSSAVLAAVLLEKVIGFSIDGYAGVLVAILLLVGGIKFLRETINPLLGEPPTEELVEELRARLLAFDGISGVHDIIIHNYGPNQYFATAHAEVDLDGNLLEVHDLLEGAEVEIGKEMPIHLLLHCDPYNTQVPAVSEWRVKLEKVVDEFDSKFKVYDFRLVQAEDSKVVLQFHMLVPRNYIFSYDEVKAKLTDLMSEKYEKDIKLQIEFINSYI